MDKFLTIGLGGFLGANARYLVGGWAADRFGATFPFGTMVINVSGSFLIGLFMTLAVERWAAPPSLRLFFAVGFLGAYTTFSTFTLESLMQIESRAYMSAAMNVLGSLLLGMVAVAAGALVGRWL